MDKQGSIVHFLSGEYLRTIFVLQGVKKMQKMTIFGASYGNWHFTYLRIEAQKEGIFDNFCRYPIKQKLFSSTPPTWGWTMEASFPIIFGFFGLRNTHSQQ